MISLMSSLLTDLSKSRPELSRIFHEINREYFDGFLETPVLRWNARLRSSAGRFFPGARRLWNERPAIIEIASYLCEESNAMFLVKDTMAHEMIHYWLWIRKRPYGHTSEFIDKMKQMGVSRYNVVPRQRPYKYVYQCISCRGEFKARRKLGPLACAKCCKEHNQGKYDVRFKLFLARRIAPPDASDIG